MTDQQPVPRVSDAARIIATLVPELPAEAREHLGRLIQRRLTVTDPHVRRYARLGLLSQVTSVGTGVLPTVRDYEIERARRAALGEDWPEASTLIQGHGSWVTAVKVAMRMAILGVHQGSKEPNTEAIRRSVTYSNADCVRAVLRCREALGGFWPTEYEYEDWRREMLHIARLAGTDRPGNPTRKVWKRQFGTWRALDGAARQYEATGSLDEPGADTE